MKTHDAAVIRRSIDRPAQFATIFERHGDAIHAYLTRRAGRQAADDLAGDVWLAALHSRHR